MAELLDQQVADQIVAQFSAGQVARNKAAIQASIVGRRLTPFTSCDAISGAQPGKEKALQVINRVGQADPEPITKTVLWAVGKILGAFTKHHAQAVVKEQSGLCGTVPELQAALDQADNLFTSGATPTSLISDLRATSTAFKTSTQGIFKECNAACFYQREFDAQIDVRAKVDYQRSTGNKVIAFVKRNKLAVGLTTAVAVVGLVMAKTL